VHRGGERSLNGEDKANKNTIAMGLAETVWTKRYRTAEGKQLEETIGKGCGVLQSEPDKQYRGVRGRAANTRRGRERVLEVL
jgi:hypothetical protein